MTTSGAAVSAQDANYVQSSISGDRFEITGGKFALKQSTNSAVLSLARRLIKDHTASLAKTVGIAKQFGIKVPMAPTPSEVWELNTVHTMSGANFDLSYTSLEVKDHQQDIEEATFETSHGSNPTIKQDAKTELPTLQIHLKLAQSAAKTARRV
jgi:predicted outer membrane protein